MAITFKRKDLIKDLRSSFYKPCVGLVLRKNMVKGLFDGHQIDIIRDEGKTIIIDATILYPLIQHQDDVAFLIRLELTNRHVVDIPVAAIIRKYRCGWPRDGHDPRYFTDIPWRMLKPMRRFLDDEISAHALLSSLIDERFCPTLRITEYYLRTIVPYIKSHPIMTNEDRQKLSDYYQLAFSLHIEEMRKAHSYGPDVYMYLGVYPYNIDAGYFLPDTANDNPLIRIELDFLFEMRGLLKGNVKSSS